MNPKRTKQIERELDSTRESLMIMINERNVFRKHESLPAIPHCRAAVDDAAGMEDGMSDWQPIETIPTDGRFYLVYCRDWSPPRFFPAYSDKVGISVYGARPEDGEYLATHWVSLEPPE